METIFSLLTNAAMSGWLALAAGLFWRQGREALFLYSGRLLPALLAAAYAGLLVRYWTGAPSIPPDPGSIAGVRALLSPDLAIAAAWTHFLTFDLFVGTWIARDGLERSVPRIALVVILFVTLWAGPAGLLAYLPLRTMVSRRAPQ
jgi:hypothetical protein